MFFWNHRLRVGTALLAAAMLLALLKPAFYLVLDPKPGNTGLRWDYGVPTQWYGRPDGQAPPAVRLPKDSIGQDFLSLDTYLRCAGLGPDMYRSHCAGDPFERPFAYPPLLAAAFFWVNYFSTSTATAAWSVTALFLIGIVLILWGFFPAGPKEPRRSEATGRVLVPAFLLTLSYPAVFAFERGNTEALILMLLSLAAWSIARRSWFWVGFFTALAAVAKLYPLLILAAVAFLAGWFIFEKENRRAGALLLSGSALGVLLPAAALARQHAYYLNKVLPALSRAELPNVHCSYCHSWPAAYEIMGYGLAAVLGGLAILHFAVFARRFAVGGSQANLNRCLISFAFGIGISGYVQNTSYDYSLILLFPLLMMCMLWDECKINSLRGSGFVILLAGTTLPRWLEGLVWRSGGPSVFLALQTLGLALIGVSLLLDLTDLKKKNS